MSILNIAGYQFVALDDLSTLRDYWLNRTQQLALKGTILLSQEGININISGIENAVRTFQKEIKTRFRNIHFHETWSDTIPYQRLKVRIKKQIITFPCDHANPVTQRAPAIFPSELKQWLDDARDFTLLDVRNTYEIAFGSFVDAQHLPIDDFSQLPAHLSHVSSEKPVVMFCTGGIRCEKAALYMLQHGYSEVYQLQGGILGYLHAEGSVHYKGECFVFDERIALDSELKTSGTLSCQGCQTPILSGHPECAVCKMPQV